jgi:hypothetical protein
MNISQCYCILRLRVCRLSRGFRSHRSRFRRRGGYSDAARTILLSSNDYSWGGGCSHCRRGPHAKVPQSSSRVTGESSYWRMSSWSLESTISRRLLRSRICRRSSQRNENCFPFLFDHRAGTGRYGCGGGEVDVRLIVEEICDFLVDVEEAVPGVKDGTE